MYSQEEFNSRILDQLDKISQGQSEIQNRITRLEVSNLEQHNLMAENIARLERDMRDLQQKGDLHSSVIDRREGALQAAGWVSNLFWASISGLAVYFLMQFLK